MNIQTHATKEDWAGRVKLWFSIIEPQENGVLARRFAPPVEYTVAHDQSLCAPPPTVEMETESAQALMDELWRIGFRPTEGSGSAGSLAATERHLEDMRRLVFAKDTP